MPTFQQLADRGRREAVERMGETFLAPGGREFKALWDSPPDVVLDVQTNTPQIEALHEELARLPRGTIIVRCRENARYTVENHEPDGHLGTVVIALSRKP